jgi:hypothetical protein
VSIRKDINMKLTKTRLSIRKDINMKLTKTRLKQIIKEELRGVLKEENYAAMISSLLDYIKKKNPTWEQKYLASAERFLKATLEAYGSEIGPGMTWEDPRELANMMSKAINRYRELLSYMATGERDISSYKTINDMNSAIDKADAAFAKTPGGQEREAGRRASDEEFELKEMEPLKKAVEYFSNNDYENLKGHVAAYENNAIDYLKKDQHGIHADPWYDDATIMDYLTGDSDVALDDWKREWLERMPKFAGIFDNMVYDADPDAYRNFPRLLKVWKGWETIEAQFKKEWDELIKKHMLAHPQGQKK